MKPAAPGTWKSGTWKSAGFVLLRTPLLPFDAWSRWADGLPAIPASLSERELEQRLAQDRTLLRQRLREKLTPVVREALFLVSPQLVEHLGDWLAEPEGRRGRAVEIRLASYLARMAGRSTPFGLAAGVTPGTVGERTFLELAAGASRRTRLDMRCLVSLTEALQALPAMRRSLSYRPNPTLHPAAGGLRYVQTLPSPVHRELRAYEFVVCEPTPHLEAVLARAAGGALREDLARALADPSGELWPEAEAFIDELIDAQILVSDLEPTLTGPDPVASLADQLRTLPAACSMAEELDEVLAGCAALDELGPGAPVEHYARVLERLSTVRVDPGDAPPFQVDLLKPAACVQVGENVIREIGRGVDLLWRLGRSFESPWQRFRATFAERYGEREVPLLEALDVELGVGFPPLADLDFDLRPAVPSRARPAETLVWRRQDAELLRRVSAIAAAGGRELRLDETGLAALENGQPGPRLSCFCVLATLIASSAGEIDRGRFQVHLHGFGFSTNLLGRFCHLDEELARQVAALRRCEEASDPEAVFADVVHSPAAGRVGNVICRPVSGYEIPCLGRSGAPPERQIEVADLRVSVRGGRVVLTSQRLGCEVRPRLAVAHAFGLPGNLPVYRFLAGLGQQDLTEIPLWEWGPVLSALPFLPRVTCGRLVVAPARWTLDASDLRELEGPSSTAAHRLIQAWRRERGWPRLAVLREADRRLPVDLDNALSVGSLVHHLRRRSVAASLEELLPGPGGLCATGSEGRFAHELIVPFVREAPLSEQGEKPRPASAMRAAGVPRTFPPGSEWVYARLYAAGSLADRLLVETVGPLVRSLREAGLVDRWFFIRYADPEPHLRLRLHGTDGPAILARLHQAVAPALAERRLWKVQLDTYEREVERYGGAAAIDLAEEIFASDSDAVLALLAGNGRPGLWRLGLAGVDALLCDFGLDLAARRGLAGRLREAYRAEFPGDPGFIHRAAGLFRAHRGRLTDLLTGERPAPLRKRSRRLEPLIAALRDLERAGALERPFEALIASHVHMHLDRVLRGDLRSQEAVVYDLLFRIYDSLCARTVRPTEPSRSSRGGAPQILQR